MPDSVQVVADAETAAVGAVAEAGVAAAAELAGMTLRLEISVLVFSLRASGRVEHYFLGRRRFDRRSKAGLA